MKVETMRLMTYQVATRASHGIPSILLANLAKCNANQMSREVAGMGMQIFGGYGVSREFPIERHFRRAWTLGIGGGTIEMQKITIASQLLGRRFNQRR